MTKKEIEICDDCKKKVGESKCEFCGADMCDDCKSFISLNVGPKNSDETCFMKITACEKCSEIIFGINLSEEFKNYPDLKKQFIDIFTRLIQLEELEGKSVSKKKDIFSSTKYKPIGYPIKKYKDVYYNPYKQKDGKSDIYGIYPYKQKIYKSK